MIGQDLRFALRTLAKRPGFAVVAVLTLALGIGANTAVFSVVESVLLRPLPVKDPGGLVMVWEHNLRRNNTHNVVNPANYLAWQERNRSFDSITAFSYWGQNLTGSGEPARIFTGSVTANFFTTLGVSPALGRVFVDADGAPNAPGVVVLSDGLWKRRFGGDAAAIGKSITLNGDPKTIVGVMPASFTLPAAVDMWTPFRVDQAWANARGRWLFTIARLKPGVAIATARADIETIAARLQVEERDRDAGWSANVVPLHADLVRGVRPAALVLAGAVVLVLLIACGNLANLLLARALGREREIAVRRALGASNGRLVRQLLVESLLLALLGGLAGIWLASTLVDALVGIVPAQVRDLFQIGLDPRALAFTLVISCLSAVLFGLAPAVSLVRSTLAPALREGSSGTGQGRERRRLSRLLVASEIALSVVLLAGASLLLRSFDRLSNVDPGFRPESVLAVDVSLPDTSYSQPATISRYYNDALARIGTIPGVHAAGAISWRPLASGSATRIRLFDRPAPAAGEEPVADIRIVTPGTFRALGIPLRRGRDFEATDAPGRRFSVIVNERMVREFWPNEEPIGKRVRMSWTGDPEGEVVGVVGDVRLSSLDTEARPCLYWPEAQVSNSFMTFVVRAEGDPMRLLAPARAALAAIDKDVPLASATTLTQTVDDSLRQPRFLLGLLMAFAVTAALLATIGLFGVLSYGVSQRLPEFGVRLAIGARPDDILRLILSDGVRLAAAGAVAGIIGALALSQVLSSLLYQVSPRDPFAFAATGAVVAGASVLAVLLPALRASRTDPSRALRAE